ncbi:hypothetical protein RclHR1_06670005 [Rhizophagus clarus]|uniref:Uncharacterized protein n=1 Tax=Rhizophagus clarus TaxID=94130 RepID=A0A2Z6S5W1_9GLOM|nr:hypothetical protein RclHR1_06670005 [Rhizophagus clarus]GES75446.1 hypothetical protein GLOIN_2v1668330 [Rhizophagus clarus]
MQRNILQIQHGSITNEQIKPSLHEINLKQENNNEVNEEYNYDSRNHQSFITSEYEKTANQCDNSIHFSANLAESTTSHSEEPSHWSPKHDSPLLETKNNNEDNDSFSELLKKVNDILETREKAYGEERELLDKINILKTDNRKIRSKVNKMCNNELNPYHRYSKSNDFFLPCNEGTGHVCNFLQVYEKHENNRCRMHENVNNNTDGFTHENELRYLIRKYTPSRNILCSYMDEPTRAYRNGCCSPTWLNNESNTIANLEGQFTGASLEYWGNNSIGSVEHSLTQSEWNILKSPNESANWLQHSFNQSNWLKSNTSSPHDLYA